MIATKPQPKTKLDKGLTNTSPTNNVSASYQARHSESTCIVSKGTILDGQVNSAENVRLDGYIKGELHCEKKVVMGSTGKAEGKVKTKDADISGTIEGELIVTGTLILRATAKIKGSLTAKYLNVEEGAIYDGDCKIG